MNQEISKSILFNPRDGHSVKELIEKVLKENPGYAICGYPAIHSIMQITQNAEMWKANFWIEPVVVNSKSDKALRDEMNTWRQRYYDLKNRMEKTLHKDDKR